MGCSLYKKCKKSHKLKIKIEDMKSRSRFLAVGLFTLSLFSCTTTSKTPQLGVDPIEDVIGAMTVEEKAAILNGTGMPGYDGITPVVGEVDLGRVPGAAGGTFAIPRLGIPEIIVADGPAGLRIQPKRKDDDATYYATAFPVGTSLACTWNTDLINSVGKAMGEEVKEYGVDVLLAPALNIHRNPLCGRNFEYYSEDPLISGKTAAAMVNGVQSNGVGTSIKHFAANNQEDNRLSINAIISERAMREIYLRGFEIAVKEAQPWTVMSSYNLVNGTYTSARKDLLTDILRDEWGFKGIVMTDWFGGFAGFGSIGGKASNTVPQLTAGNDLLMPGMDSQKEAIVEALNNGTIDKAVVDRNIKRILELIMKSPTFKKKTYSNKPDLKKHAEITRQAACEGMVLLKNDKNTLPYADKSGKVAVFGVTSYNFIAGGTGSGDVNEAYTVSLMDGLKNAGYKVDTELEEMYVPYAKKVAQAEEDRKAKEGGLLAASKKLPEMPMDRKFIAKKAASTDLAIITIGRNAGEQHDRVVDNDFDLGTDEIKMIDDISSAYHNAGKKVVVILNIGGVIETASWKDNVDAILLAWQAGQEGGNSVADVFSGVANPSGKLTMTFPVQFADVPSSENWNGLPAGDPKEVDYKEDVFVGYRYYNTKDVKTSYEFGYGLSYTNFNYTDIKLSLTDFTDKVEVSVKVTNTGKVAGKEVVELYLSAPKGELDKPAEELKAYAKTKTLKPGESQTIILSLRAEDLASFSETQSAWIADAGEYAVKIGASSLDIRQTATFNLPETKVVEKTHKAFAMSK